MMKKTIFILTALAALACTAISCRKEFAEMQPGTGFTVTATIAGGGTAENGTKVSATDDDHSLALKWEQGDKLIGFDNHNKTYGFEVTSVDGGKATLTRIEDGDEDERGTATTDPADGTTMYMLYVPGKTVENLDLTSNPSECILSYDLSTQAVDALPVSMTAQGTVTDGKLDLTFKVQTAIIGIKNPTMENDATTSIILSSSATSGLNTKVTFILDGGGDLKATYGSGDAETVTKAVNFTSTTPGTNTFIVVCPVTSAADLTFTSDKGEAFTKTGKTVAAGKYYYMSPIFESMGREITVSFGSATSALFGGSLTFDSTKKIRVSNETEFEDCDITIVGGGTTATITTELDGDLTAVYPSTAAKMNSTEPNKIDGVQVSATQDGTIAGALATKATVTETGNTAVFNNQTAVFKITLPTLTTNATSLKVKSLPPATSASRTSDKVGINTVGSDVETKSVITVSGTITSGRTIFVSLTPGVKLCDLAFDATTGTYTGTMAGIPGSGSSEATAANTLYEVDGTNFHEYVQVGTVKWAKTNIGATTETGRGKYFMWGETTGHTASGTLTKSSTSPISNAFTEGFKNNANGFAETNAPYYQTTNPMGYNKYTSSEATLDLMDDAAYVNWGGPWSMPTKDNFSALCSNSGTMEHTDTSIDISSSSYGYRISVTGGTIFFPANGYGNAQSLNDFGSTADPTFKNMSYYRSCLYWINTLCSGTKPYSFTAYDGRKTPKSSFNVSDISLSMTPNATKGVTKDNARHYGFPIRPVSIY